MNKTSQKTKIKNQLKDATSEMLSRDAATLFVDVSGNRSQVYFADYYPDVTDGPHSKTNAAYTASQRRQRGASSKDMYGHYIDVAQIISCFFASDIKVGCCCNSDRAMLMNVALSVKISAFAQNTLDIDHKGNVDFMIQRSQGIIEAHSEWRIHTIEEGSDAPGAKTLKVTEFEEQCEHLASVGCSVIFFDGADTLTTGNDQLDKDLFSQIKMIAKKLAITIVCV